MKFMNICRFLLVFSLAILTLTGCGEQKKAKSDNASSNVKEKKVQKTKRPETTEEAIERIVHNLVLQKTKGKNLPKTAIIGMKATLRKQLREDLITATAGGMTEKEYLSLLEEQLKAML